MREPVIRVAGLVATLLYAALIVWTYATQPRTLAEARGGVASTVGLYRADPEHFQEGLAFFRQEKFAEARAAFQRADPAQRDAETQFYMAYSYYRQGWGRVYNDDALFRRGIEAIDRATTVSSDGRVVVDDDDLGMQTADELRAELERGLTRDASDLNPMRVFRKRL